MLNDEQKKAEAKTDLLEVLAYNLLQVAAELAVIRSQDVRAVATEYRAIFETERDIDVRIQCYRNAIRRAISEISERKKDPLLRESLTQKYLPAEPDVLEATTESA